MRWIRVNGGGESVFRCLFMMTIFGGFRLEFYTCDKSVAIIFYENEKKKMPAHIEISRKQYLLSLSPGFRDAAL